MSAARKLRRTIASKAIGGFDLGTLSTLGTKLDQLAKDTSKLEDFSKGFEGTGEVLLLLGQLQKDVEALVTSNNALQSKVAELELSYNDLWNILQNPNP